MNYDFLMNEDLSDYLQSLSYNVRYYSNILSHLMSHNLDDNDPENDKLFDEYYDEYLKYYMEYRHAMDSLAEIALGDYSQYITGIRFDYSTDAVYFYTKSGLNEEVREELIWRSLSSVGIRKSMNNFRTP